MIPVASVVSDISVPSSPTAKGQLYPRLISTGAWSLVPTSR